MPTLISAAIWVPQGASARNPRRQDLSDPAELERVERLGKVKLDQARKDLEDELDRMQLDENSNVDDGGEEDNDDDESEERESLDLEDDDDDGDDDDPVAKARKMQATIKRDIAAKPATGENTASNDDEDVDKLYKLDDYDKEVSQTASLGVFSTIRGLAFHPGGSEADPYVTLEDPAAEDAELDREELEILPTDNLVVCAKTADDVSLLETHVYENYEDDADDDNNAYDGGNLYAHHDALLPAMPLCLEWGDCRPSTSKGDAKGSFVAVGTMDKHIEIWDLDVVDGLIPEAILGDDSLDEAEQAQGSVVPANDNASQHQNGVEAMSVDAEDAVDSSTTSKKKKKKKKKPKHSSIPEPLAVLPHAHTDSVLSLSWNRVHRSLLASASADSTVKLWDLQSPACQRAIRSFQLHGEQKVQSVSWNPVEATVLLSGAWGGGVKIFDSRTPESSIGCQLLQDADVEALHWDPHGAGNAQFYAASGKGQVLYWDSRHLSKAVWTLDAHDGPVSALDVNDFIPGCIVTGGIDKQVKVWSITNSAPAQKASSGKQSTNASISLVHSRDFGVGKVFCANWSPDDPTLVCLAGSAAKLNVWDAFTNPGFRRTFGDRLKDLDATTFGESSKRARGNGLVALQDDNEAYETDDE